MCKWKKIEWAKGKMVDCKFNGNVKEELDSTLSQLKVTETWTTKQFLYS